MPQDHLGYAGLQAPVTQTINDRHLKFFGYIIHSDSEEDHTSDLNAGIDDSPKEWRRPRGRPRQMWLLTTEQDLKQQNLGLWAAQYRAYDCDLWSQAMETEVLQQGHATLIMMMMMVVFKLELNYRKT